MKKVYFIRSLDSENGINSLFSPLYFFISLPFHNIFNILLRLELILFFILMSNIIQERILEKV
jgi:hypothetical protein